MTPKKWFDRVFEFDLEPFMFPNVLERLRGTPARLEDIVYTISPEHLTLRIQGEWSIQENIGHLLDLEPLWRDRVGDIFAGKEKLRDADLTNRKTHHAKHNNGRIAIILQAFRQERMALLERVEDIDSADIEKAALHPRLEKPMRLIDLMFFVAEHDDHHLATITRLRKCHTISLAESPDL